MNGIEHKPPAPALCLNAVLKRDLQSMHGRISHGATSDLRSEPSHCWGRCPEIAGTYGTTLRKLTRPAHDYLRLRTCSGDQDEATKGSAVDRSSRNSDHSALISWYVHCPGQETHPFTQALLNSRPMRANSKLARTLESYSRNNGKVFKGTAILFWA